MCVTAIVTRRSENDYEFVKYAVSLDSVENMELVLHIRSYALTLAPVTKKVEKSSIDTAVFGRRQVTPDKKLKRILDSNPLD